MSSIGQTCLNLTQLAHQIKAVFGRDEHQDRINSELLPQWLDEILSRGYPDASIIDTVTNALNKSLWEDCTVLEEGSDERIVCHFRPSRSLSE